MSRVATPTREKSLAQDSGDQLERLASLGLVLSTVAHEINNLLTPVLSYAELALHSPDDPALKDRALRQAMVGAERAAAIAAALLALSRGTSEQAHADVGAVIDDALLCLGRDLSKDRIELIRRIPARLTAGISPIALQQVVLNLVMNAREAMHGRVGRLVIEAAPVAGGMLEIRFSDSGPGITPEISKRLFEAFNSSSVRGDARGTGLGLMICRRLLDAVGGRISLAPSSDSGATFVVVIPAGAHAASNAA